MDKRELRKANGDVFFEAVRMTDNSFIKANWIGLQSLESIVMGSNLLLSMLREKPCSALLNSNSELVGPWEVGVKWLAMKWAPEAKAFGVRYFAHVLSHGIFGKRSFQTLLPLIENEFDVRSFDDETAAEEWIKFKMRIEKPSNLLGKTEL